MKALIQGSGRPARDFVRTRETAYKKLGLADKGDAALVDAMVRHPELIQRPIVAKGKRVVLARPLDNLQSLL